MSGQSSAGEGVLITGANGAIGHAMREFLPMARGIDERDLDLVRFRPEVKRDEHTVIHLAGYLAEDSTTAALNLSMMLNVMEACRGSGVGHLIIASSVCADEPSVAFPVTYYGAAKLAQESMLRAWAAERQGRAGVALRFGHFSSARDIPIRHEVLRLDETALEYWTNRAMVALPGFHVLHATGRLNRETLPT